MSGQDEADDDDGDVDTNPFAELWGRLKSSASKPGSQPKAKPSAKSKAGAASSRYKRNQQQSEVPLEIKKAGLPAADLTADDLDMTSKFETLAGTLQEHGCGVPR